MNVPMNYAIVADGVVVNVIWVRPDQAEEFPGAVPGFEASLYSY